MEQKIFGVIYKITNSVNDKVYIGETISLGKRWKQHLSAARVGKSKQYIHNAMRKYNIENFTVEIIAIAPDRKVLNYLERFFINVYESNLKENGYNIARGGYGGGKAGYKHTESAKQKISLASKGKSYPCSEETRKKISDTRTKQSVTQMSQTGETKTYDSLRTASKITDINIYCIRMCCKGKRKTAGGFMWIYATPSNIISIGKPT